jgi:periplasmic protein CpxP/Spy
MRNSKLKLTVTAAALASSVALFSAFANGDGGDMMTGHSEHSGMMGMMNMMSDMSPEDRKSMTEACMKMMQGHDSDGMHGDMEDKDTEAK